MTRTRLDGSRPVLAHKLRQGLPYHSAMTVKWVIGCVLLLLAADAKEYSARRFDVAIRVLLRIPHSAFCILHSAVTFPVTPPF